MTSTPLIRKSGRTVKYENELEVLKAIRFFGHLRRAELAMAVWTKSAPKSAYLMACRTVSALKKAGALLERPNILGGTSLILSAKGVSRLLSEDISATEGYELAFDGPQFFHRTLGTCYLLEKARSGDRVYGEYSILKGWSPLDRTETRIKYSKAPDGLIVYSGAELGYRAGINVADWVEIESAFKSYKNIKKALDILIKDSQLDSKGNLFLNKIVFVFDSRQKHERQILRYIVRFLKENKHRNLDENHFLSQIIFARCYVDIPFAWRGVSEHTAKDLMDDPAMLQTDKDSVLDSDEDDDEIEAL